MSLFRFAAIVLAFAGPARADVSFRLSHGRSTRRARS